MKRSPIFTNMHVSWNHSETRAEVGSKNISREGSSPPPLQRFKPRNINNQMCASITCFPWHCLTGVYIIHLKISYWRISHNRKYGHTLLSIKKKKLRCWIPKWCVTYQDYQSNLDSNKRHDVSFCVGLMSPGTVCHGWLSPLATRLLGGFATKGSVTRVGWGSRLSDSLQAREILVGTTPTVWGYHANSRSCERGSDPWWGTC